MIALDRRDAVQLVTLDRPDRSNALHPELVSALGAALERTAADQGVRVVVLTGAGKSFCAGLDLDHLVALDGEGAVEYMRSAFALFRQVYELPQPVIAAVNGPAMAGGFDLAAFSDIRLCSSTARFAQTEIFLGLTQIIYPVYEVIGLARARELALTGRTISAEEAHGIGLVSSVHAPGDLLREALRLAGELASRPPRALMDTKRLSRELVALDAGSAMERMFDAIAARLGSEEHRRALAAWAERVGSGRRRSRGSP